MKIEIDDQHIEADLGESVIEVADRVGIPIPRFCYHPRLSVAANCRMCLVDVEKSSKPLPACATSVTEGMKIWTRSQKARRAQKSVLAFLLANHPLDCPICDEGGECDLQNLAMGFGEGVSHFKEAKRAVADENLGALISTEMTRCIHCTRCVRFGSEIAGKKELGLMGRGEQATISTYVGQFVESHLSGNIIDLCPVGALTSKPFRFQARAWELKSIPSIAPHDNWGTHVIIQTRRDQIMRVLPREKPEINENWLSDRDRFSYTALQSTDRLLTPKIKKQGRWKSISWAEALEHVKTDLQAVITQYGADQLGGIISPSSTTEEAFLFQKLCRALGSNHIDHRLKETDFKHQAAFPLLPHLGVPISELPNQATITLVGCDLPQEQPLGVVRVRQALQQGAQILSINPIDFDYPFTVHHTIIPPQGDLVLGLSTLVQALAKETQQALPQWIEPVVLKPVDQAQAKLLCAKKPGLFLLGALALHHPRASALCALAWILEKQFGFQIGCLPEGANVGGLWLSGCVPHRMPWKKSVDQLGFDCVNIFEVGLKAYILKGIEPSKDLAQTLVVKKALDQAKWVCAITSFESEDLLTYADLLLPCSAFGETSGTYINAAGDWQSFEVSVRPPNAARPAWKILQAMGQVLEQPDFEYETAQAVLADLRSHAKPNTVEPWDFSQAILETCFAKQSSDDTMQTDPNVFLCISPTHIHDLDALTRRAKPLRAKSAPDGILRVNQQAKSALIQYQGHQFRVPVKPDKRVPKGVAWLERGAVGLEDFSKPYCWVKITFSETS